LELPDGTTLVDARGLAKPEEIDLRTQGGQKGCLASFSNIYRYRLLSQEGGWWFDTDVFCLADNEAFLEVQEHSPGISVGFETETQLNGAVMYVSEPSFARELEALAEAKGHVIGWGEIGPLLITEYYHAHRDRVVALPQEAFYPVLYSDILLLFDPDAKSTCENAVAGSFCVHIHNTNRAARGIPKDIMPCEGSYLEELFISVGAETSTQARLPIDVIRLRRKIETLEKSNERCKQEMGLLRLDLAHLTGLQEKIDRIYASRTWRLGSLFRKLAIPPLVLWRLGRCFSTKIKAEAARDRSGT
jgi:hypothetical protein